MKCTISLWVIFLSMQYFHGRRLLNGRNGQFRRPEFPAVDTPTSGIWNSIGK